MMRPFLLALVLCAGPALAVQPDEVLDDPSLEARARDISSELRCLVCRNESIDESSADLARDLRLLVRERLVAGDSDREVMDYVTDRYGEFVLLRPTFGGANLILWISGPLMLLAAGGIAAAAFRARGQRDRPEDELSEAERRRLDELMGD